MRNPAHCSNLWHDSGKDPVLNGHLLNLWRFGDVFKVPFEKWYDREHEGMSWAAIEIKDYFAWIDRKLVLQDKAYCKSMGLPYIMGKGLMATVEPKSIWDDPNVLRQMIDTPGQRGVNIRVNVYASDKEIRNAVSKIVKQYKKKTIPSLESLQDYLATYDLFKEPGRTELDVANTILSKFKVKRLSHNETINRIRLYHKNARTIIHNVEQGYIYFPGEY
jgi:hypothetical protein